MCLNNYLKAAGSALRNSTHSDLKLICRLVATIVILTIIIIITNVILTMVIVIMIIMVIVIIIIIIIIVITSDGVVAAHQCLLEPLSPLLSTIFQQHNCCNCRS